MTRVKISYRDYCEAHGNYNELMGRSRANPFNLFEVLGELQWYKYEVGEWTAEEPVAHKIRLLASPHYKTLWKMQEIQNDDSGDNQ